jgi:NADP-dependent 3-hydroxy acid dehydrogenase YdfG
VSFRDQVWLVTGASSGIGRAIAALLLREGAKVVLMARRAEVLEQLRAEWGRLDRVLAFAGDVTDREACRGAVAAAVEAFGRLDGVVHSAGVSMRAKVADARPEVFRSLMDVNYFSTVDLAQAALPALAASRGHFVVISSVVGKFAPPWRSGYAASKHAVQGFLDAFRIEVADQGVHVMAVCPGFVATEISRNAVAADGGKHGQMDADTAAGLDPDDVARRVLAGIARRAREIAPAGPRERMALALARFAPGLLDRMLLRRLRAGGDVAKAPGT